MLAVAAALQPHVPSVVAADPRALRAWRRSGYRARSLTIDLGTERHIIHDAHRQAESAWAAYIRARPCFAYGDADVTEATLTQLRPLVVRSLPWLHAERAALVRFLRDVQPRTLVVATDQHRIGQLATSLSSMHGARVVVLQHGLPQGEVGYLPVTADVVATWSRASAEWFKARGTDPGRLITLGNPRLDRLVGTARDPTHPQAEGWHGLHGHPRLLLALSGRADDMNVALTELAIGALRATRTGTLIVKLHPGTRDWDPVRKAIEQSGAARGRIRVAHREPLYPIIEWADVTLLHTSSVAVESLVAGRPVIILEVDGTSMDGEDLFGLDLPVVRTPEALAALVQKLATLSTRDRFLAERRTRLGDVAGPLDGHAAARIARYLLAANGSTPSDPALE